MSIGYEGYVLLDGELMLATSASAPKARNKIEAQAAYKGSVGGNGGMGYGHTYDYLSYDGNFNVELAPSIVGQLKDWIVSTRNSSKEISIQSRKSGVANAGMQRCPTAFWTSINFDASQGSALTSTVDFISWNKYINSGGTTDYNSVTDQYIENREGLISDLSLLNEIQSGGNIPALNPSASNSSPIPWWKANISGFLGSGNVAPFSWSVSFSQAIEKIFCCKAQVNPQEPVFLAIGPLIGTANIEMVVLEGSYNILDIVDNVSLTMGSSIFNVGELQLSGFSDDVQNGSSQTNIKLNYDIYGPLS